MLPKYWKEFLESNSLVGKDFEVVEENDLSDLGADLRITSEEQCVSEAKEAYPGILAARIGYFPVAMCLSGSGDYYYINTNEGKGGALYRVYHDSVSDGQIQANGIEKVLTNYESLLSIGSAL